MPAGSVLSFVCSSYLWALSRDMLALYALVTLIRRAVGSLYSYRSRQKVQSNGTASSAIEASISTSPRPRTPDKAVKWRDSDTSRALRTADQDNRKTTSQEACAAVPGTRFRPTLPPAPPLTPPQLSGTIFAAAEAPHRQDSFIHQPNPDYMNLTPCSSPPQASPATPSWPKLRRQMYSKLPPLADAPPPYSPNPFDPVSGGDDGQGRLRSTPRWPLPKAGEQESALRDGPSVALKGELVSSLDSRGLGWTRHTRVYGAGPCLACVVSGAHSGRQMVGQAVEMEASW